MSKQAAYRAALAAAFLFLTTNAEDALAQPKQPDSGRVLGEELWMKIATVGPVDASKADNAAWENAQQELSSVFFELLKKADANNDLDAYVEFLANRFPSESVAVDFKWFLAMEPYVSPSSGSHRPFSGEGSSRRSRRAQFLFAEILAKRFVADRELLARYQHFLAWRRLWIRSGNEPEGFGNFIVETGMVLNAGRFTDTSDEFWWFTRNFLVLAYTTGRNDLLPMNDDDLKHSPQRMAEWYRWIEANGCYLRPRVQTPTWALDEDLRKCGYGYVSFFTGRNNLPALTYSAPVPFRDWPSASLARDVARP